MTSHSINILAIFNMCFLLFSLPLFSVKSLLSNQILLHTNTYNRKTVKDKGESEKQTAWNTEKWTRQNVLSLLLYSCEHGIAIVSTIRIQNNAETGHRNALKFHEF